MVVGTEASEAVAGMAVDVDKASLVERVRDDGSSWAALLLCVIVRPLKLAELLDEVDWAPPLGRKARELAFDACADGFTVWEDARDSGAL